MSKRTKFLLGIGVIAALVIGWQVIAFAGPIGTAGGFEDDDANLVDNATSGIDWNTFSPVTWLPKAPPTPTSPTRTADKIQNGFTFKGIEDWQATTADSGFAGGTKQDANCPSVISAKAPNKDDLKRIYLSSTTGSNGHTYLNLAWVRIPQNTTSPSAHIGFEFNKGNNGTCGAGSGGLVQRSAGDLLIVYDFEGGGSPVLTLRKWVTSGACDVSSNSAPCWGTAVNLTASGFAEGAVNTGASTLDQLAPPALSSTTGISVNETLGISEFGEAGIDLTAAGVFPANTCNSFGKAYAVSRSSGNSGTAQMKDLVGPADFNLSNCGTVKIVKRTDPRGLNQSFSYTTTGGLTPSSFTLNDNGNTSSDSAGNTRTFTDVQAGSYTVTEGADPAGFTFTDLSCAASGTGTSATPASGNATRTANITIAGGGSVTCVYTNSQQLGAIKVTKTDSKSGDNLAGAKFSVTGPNNFSTTLTTGSDGTACVDDLAFGAYTVTETEAPPGYDIDDSSGHPVTVDTNAACDDNPYVGEGSAEADGLSFTDTPLSDIQVRFRDGGSGVTSGTISCDNTTGTTSTADTADWDDTTTVTGVHAGTAADPTVVNCTITIDP